MAADTSTVDYEALALYQKQILDRLRELVEVPDYMSIERRVRELKDAEIASWHRGAQSTYGMGG